MELYVYLQDFKDTKYGTADLGVELKGLAYKCIKREIRLTSVAVKMYINYILLPY